MHGHDVGPQGAQRDAPPGNGTHTGYTTAVVARGLGTHASPSRRTPHTHRCSLEGAYPLTIPAAAHQAPAEAVSHERTSEPQAAHERHVAESYAELGGRPLTPVQRVMV